MKVIGDLINRMTGTVQIIVGLCVSVALIWGAIYFWNRASDAFVENLSTVKALRGENLKLVERLIEEGEAYRKLTSKADSLVNVSEDLADRGKALLEAKNRLQMKVDTFYKYNKICYKTVFVRKGLKRVEMEVEVPCKN